MLNGHISIPQNIALDNRLSDKDLRVALYLYAKYSSKTDEILVMSEVSEVLGMGVATIRKHLQRLAETGYLRVRKINDTKHARTMIKLFNGEV